MCFSATASFVAAGITAAAGVAALIRVDRREDVLLAATPVFFATQQAIEGLLWMSLPAAPASTETSNLTLWFLLFAKVFWPVFSPLAVLSAEPDPERRKLMKVCVAIGLSVGAYFLWSVLGHARIAQIAHGHIGYGGGPESPFLIGAGYFVATAATPAISSHKAIRWFAAIVIASSIVTYFFYWDAFSSVWCFFAAGASAVIVFHFERARQMRQAMAGT